MWFVHTLFHPSHAGQLKYFWHNGGPLFILLAMPLFLAAVCPAFVVTNFMVWCVTPLRKIFDKEAKGFPGTDFRSATKGLIRLSLIMVPVCLLLSLLGAIILK